MTSINGASGMGFAPINQDQVKIERDHPLTLLTIRQHQLMSHVRSKPI